LGPHSALLDLIRRGRRRSLTHLIVHQAAFAATVALGGCVVLLLLGTQIFNWYWLPVLFGVSLIVGIVRTYSRVPSNYGVARAIDERLALRDALSTAFYFSEHPERTRSPREVIDKQRAAAEDLARTADLERGVPFFAPRSMYAGGALALAVFGMLALRYGVNRNLDLGPSLVKIKFDGFIMPTQPLATAKKTGPGERQDAEKPPSAPDDPEDAKALDTDPAPDSALNTVETPDLNGAEAGANPKAKASDQASNEPTPDPNESAENGDKTSPGEGAASDKSSSDKNQQSTKQGKDSDKGNNGDNSSLADKVRDALANLMSKLKMQPKPGDAQQGQTSQNSSQTAQKQGSKDQNGKPSQSQPQADGASAEDARGDQQMQSEQAQTAQGKSQGKNSERANSEDSKSGIGKQDGDKSAKEAEQLRAMGKINEIIGKRSANVTGEMMVEVASGNQSLRTQYTQRKATHVEVRGEINRDEVPLAYQQYVQQYFEEIRKLPPAAKAKTPDSKPKSSGS